jgi:hypothetical protein
MRDLLGWGRQALYLTARPVLFWEAVRTSVAFRAHRGLIPSSEYVGWRIHTAYGDGMSETLSDDLGEFLRWRRAMRRVP